VLSLSLPAYVALFSSSVPVADDWVQVQALTRQGPHGVAWLWAPHNEHRIPFPKLILLGLAGLFGYDPRTGMYFNGVALAAVSAALILAARRLRGATRWSDAFFPLALLHWGQYINLMIGASLNLVGAACLTVLFLAGVVTVRGRPSVRQGLCAGFALILLPLWGASGLVVVPALAAWLLGVGAWQLRSSGPGARRGAAAVLVPAVLALVLVGLYFVGGRAPAAPAAVRGSAVLATASQFVAMSVGPFGEQGLPFSALALALLCVATLFLLRSAWRSHPADRVRVAGLCCSFAALATLTAAVAWGRAPFGGVTVQQAGTRFVTAAVPLLIWAYLTWTAYRDGFVPVALCVLMALLLPVNTYSGYVAGRNQAGVLRAVERDVRAGMPAEELVRKWDPVLSGSSYDPAVQAERWQTLRDCRQGPYRNVSPE
jgi:hypothetical protein